MNSIRNRTLALAGLTASLVLPFAFAGTAAATTTPTPSVCNNQPVTADFKAVYAPNSVTDMTISYANAKPLCAGVAQSVSFNTYLTQGPTWARSGKQTLIDHQTQVISAHAVSAHFVSTKLAANCYYQTDAYLGTLRYDGVSGAAPHYPVPVMNYVLLAARNGGSKVCSVPTPTPMPTPVVTPTPTPIVTPTPTPGGNGGGEVLGATTLPATGAGELALVISSAASAAGYTIVRYRNR
ncbi:hypothetical protein HJC99_06845 [Candidatus Saccharibacteria bacterium]|nr:hypothetical protein [Candidatus Saccharibacteria bacterium]